MGFVKDFYSALDSALYDKKLVELAKEAHITKGVLSKIINRKTKKPLLQTVGAILDALGYKLVKR